MYSLSIFSFGLLSGMTLSLMLRLMLTKLMSTYMAFTFQSSNVIWCDFDERPPTDSELGDFPNPTHRISSSSGQKEHWYWLLNTAITDKERLEDYNRRVSRAFNGDRVAWNYSRVLRPPKSLNHKYAPPKRVDLKYREPTGVDQFLFSCLPEIPVHGTESTDWEWKRVAYELDPAKIRPGLVEFIKQPEPDHRGNALMSMCISLIELGHSRDFVMSVLDDTATRWGKFTGRKDRDFRLKQLYVRAELQADTPEPQEHVARFSVGLEDLHDMPDAQPSWAIKGLLPQSGIAVISSPPGVGKTQVSMDLAAQMALGKDALGRQVERPQKILFVSLEMDKFGINTYYNSMRKNYTPEERAILNVNNQYVFRSAFRISSDHNKEMLRQFLDEDDYTGVIFDSLSRTVGGDMDKVEVDILFDFLETEIKGKREIFTWIIHHQRKGNYMHKQPKKLEDIYGSQFIGAYVDLALGLWPITRNEIEMNCLKNRWEPQFESFLINRTPDLGFKYPTGGLRMS